MQLNKRSYDVRFSQTASVFFFQHLTPVNCYAVVSTITEDLEYSKVQKLETSNMLPQTRILC
jgi:hypothetical protein